MVQATAGQNKRWLKASNWGCALDSSRQNHVEPANTSKPAVTSRRNTIVNLTSNHRKAEFECSYVEVWRINCTGLQTNLKTSDSHHNWKAWNENSECFKILTCVLFYSVICLYINYICMQINLYNLDILNITKSLQNLLLHLEYLYNLDGTILNILNTVHIDPVLGRRQLQNSSTLVLVARVFLLTGKTDFGKSVISPFSKQWTKCCRNLGWS